MTRLLHLSISLLVSSLLCPAHAQDSNEPLKTQFYDVEIIVFKNISVPRSHEFNLPTPSASRTQNTLDLSDPDSINNASKKGFTPLKAGELKLSDSVQRIIKSSRYELLVHTGWRQPGLDESSSIPVWVKGGKIYDSSYSSIDQMTPPATSQDVGKSANAPRVASPLRYGLYELEGQITIILSRYLHAKTELVLRKPADTSRLVQQSSLTPDSEEHELMAMKGQLLLNYSLNEQRRMRSKKLHYLDHPEFGMLVLITPYEAPMENIIEQPEAETVPAVTQALSKPGD